MSIAISVQRLHLRSLAAACAVILVGCDADGPTSTPMTTVLVSAPRSTGGSTSPSAAATIGTAQVGLVGVYEDVDFYPACGNEVLGHRGVSWHPIVHVGFDPMVPELQDRVDAVLAIEREDWSPGDPHGIRLQVVEPGPGDDVGTMAVWADGVARWVSDSGKLDVWMVDDEIVYTWEC